jgi:hypothetical protein
MGKVTIKEDYVSEVVSAISGFEYDGWKISCSGDGPLNRIFLHATKEFPERTRKVFFFWEETYTPFERFPLGDIWWDNPARGASGRNLYLGYGGTQYRELVVALANHICELVDIDLNIECESRYRFGYWDGTSLID